MTLTNVKKETGKLNIYWRGRGKVGRISPLLVKLNSIIFWGVGVIVLYDTI